MDASEPVGGCFSVGDDDEVPWGGEAEKLVYGGCGVVDGCDHNPFLSSYATTRRIEGRFGMCVRLLKAQDRSLEIATEK